jgi:two-component system, chemotaxis family, response regulator Rcp1
MVFEILLVEDNPAEARLTVEILKDTQLPTNIHVVKDGVEALNYLRQVNEYSDYSLPDLILLDLNLPKKNGREVLAEIKQDIFLRQIPVIILTTSSAEQDIQGSYELNANCYITKPVNLEQFTEVIRLIEKFWLSAAKLPKEKNRWSPI